MTGKKAILPPETTAGVKQMIKITEQLIETMERESMALARNDAVSFAAAQEEKNHLSVKYEQASAEFGRRLEEFRNVNEALIDKLGALQQQLKDKALDSTAAMERVRG